MSNRILLQGMLAEKQLKLRDYVTRADGLVSSLHMQCNPYLAVHELAVDEIRSQARDLERSVLRIRDLMHEVKELKKELGLDEE
jgi:hypothetical protein